MRNIISKEKKPKQLVIKYSIKTVQLTGQLQACRIPTRPGAWFTFNFTHSINQNMFSYHSFAIFFFSTKTTIGYR